MIPEALDAIVERRYRELLEDKGHEPCAVCGCKPMTQATLVQALRGAVSWLASRSQPQNGAGTGFGGEDDDGG